MRLINIMGSTLLILSGTAWALTPPTQVHVIPKFTAPVVQPLTATTGAPSQPAGPSDAMGLPVAPIPQAVPDIGQNTTADTAALPDRDSSITRKLDILRSQAAILTEQLRIAKLRASIAKTQGGGEPPVSSGETPNLMSATLPPAQVVILPSVKSVQGFNGKLTADIIYADGSTLKVHTGQRLADGSVVTHIGNDGVTIRTSMGSRLLPMYNANSANSSAASTLGMPVSPPLQAPPLPPAMQSMPPSTDSTSTGNGGNG